MPPGDELPLYVATTVSVASEMTDTVPSEVPL